MVVVCPLLRVLPSKVLLRPRVLPQPRGLGDPECRNGVALSKVCRVLPLLDRPLVVPLLDQVGLFSEDSFSVQK